MKKIIGIFSAVLLVGAMLLNINLSSKTNTTVDLAGLIATNVANAETGQNGCFYTGWSRDQCGIPPYIPKMYCEPSYMNACNQ